MRPKQLLSADAIRLAQKRVRDVPAVATARVSYHPTEEGRAQIDASVLERDRAPLTYPAWLGIGAGALANREATVAFTNVSGGGDAITATWRWWQHRPMIGAAYAAPGPGGIWTIDASSETQTFGTAALEETRTQAGVDVRNWIGQRARVAGGSGIERWTDRGRYASFTGAIEFWPLVDRLALEGRVTSWRGGGDPFATAAATARFRSRVASTGTVWLFDAGYRAATESSPASAWPGADTGHARDVLLRAHPLLDEGIITGGVLRPPRVIGRRRGPALDRAPHPAVPLRARRVRRHRARDARAAGDGHAHPGGRGRRPAGCRCSEWECYESTRRTACVTDVTRCRLAGSGERGKRFTVNSSR